MRLPFRRAAAATARQRGFFSALFTETPPLDLRILGRTLLHAALVGLCAGLVAVLFFAGLELVEGVLLGQIMGYARLRAGGEKVLGGFPESPTFHLWLLPVIPALGALAGGVLTTKFASEAAGGGGDAVIHAFHHGGGVVRRRVAWVKAVASILTLGSGGAGGREGPTMQIGGALGSLVGRTLHVGSRERRILLMAGVAAGMSAIFRTPLGAALFAAEVLYRDDFESDALVPALLASVVSYSVFISFYGESTLFAHASRYPFIPAHLPLYAVLSVLLSLLAIVFLNTLGAVKKIAAKVPGPLWIRPGLGGLALGLFCVPILWFAGRQFEAPGHGIGLLGGGYGIIQVAITGASWIPSDWRGVELLLLLCAAKLVASSLTLGSGGSAGDFAPSLVLGGLFGGAFGRAASLVVGDPRIDAGAFALVGMGTFYGGIAHVPVSSLVMVCELAGSYDLLVPLMLAEAIAFIALRKRFLYHSQLPTQRDSPAHPAHVLDVLKAVTVREAMPSDRTVVRFDPSTSAGDMLRGIVDSGWQDVFPVVDRAGTMVGMVTSESLRILASDRELETMTIAADVMRPPVAVRAGDELRVAIESMLAHGVRELPVVDDEGRIAGLIGEADIGRMYLEATAKIAERGTATPLPRDEHDVGGAPP